MEYTLPSNRTENSDTISNCVSQLSLTATHGYMISDNYTNYTQNDDVTSAKTRVKDLISSPHICMALALGLIAIALNVLSLAAISQIRSRMTNHYRLIISLALSDIVIGLSIIFFVIHTVVNKHQAPGMGPPAERLKYWCSAMLVKGLNSTGLNISLINLLGMALDHYTAIVRPLHYPSLINSKKSYIFYAGSWIFALLLGFSDFLTGFEIYLDKNNNYNYCEACRLSQYQDDYAVFFVTIVTTIVMTFIYVKLYIKIKHYRSPGQVVQSIARRNSTRSDIVRNKRALITTLLILLTFMICWLPNCFYQITMLIIVHVPMFQSTLISWSPVLENTGWYMYDLLLINSIADPIIYAVRTFDVQLGYRRLIRKCCPQIKNIAYTDYAVRTNLIDRKTSSRREGAPNRKAPPHGAANGGAKNTMELEAATKRGANCNGSVRQVVFPKRDKSESTSSSSRSQDVVVVYRSCHSEP